MILDAWVLRGYPKERAELYGKPHLGAHYTHGKAYEALSQRCCVCGRRAGSVHHVAHRSWGETFRLVTPCGTWDLRSPLFCLCGSGTTGCHDKFHGGARLKAEWRCGIRSTRRPGGLASCCRSTSRTTPASTNTDIG